MKKLVLLSMLILTAFGTLIAQKKKWSELSQEEQIMKAQSFRQDNLNYLKTTLGFSEEQVNDIDNINLCYLGALDRINRYAKDDAAKEKAAKTATTNRSAQLDAIMGTDKRKQYQDYILEKIKKATGG